MGKALLRQRHLEFRHHLLAGGLAEARGQIAIVVRQPDRQADAVGVVESNEPPQHQ